MGINGLLQFLKQCYVDKRVSDFQGQTAAVDTYAWLHKIIKGESGKCLVKGGKQKFKFVKDIMRRVQKINNAGVKLILVFDGGPLPRKRQEQQFRRKKRQQTLQKAKELLSNGETQQGYKKMAQSVDITPDIAYHLIKEIKRINKPYVQFLVAPYEADAQLAYLNRQGIVDFIITQDSDMLAFGAKKVLYKLDFQTMSGKLIQLDTIKKVLFNWFSHCMFLTTCILCGCDYLNQLPGIGLKKAKQKISRGSTFKSFIQQMQKNSVPEDYQQNFMKAFLTFRYQRVYNPINKQCVEINQMHFDIAKEKLKQQNSKKQQWSKQILNQQVLEFVQANLNSFNFDFLGPKHPKQRARQIGEGQINPISLKPYQLDNLQYLEEYTKITGNGEIKKSSSQFNMNRNNKNSKDKSNYVAQSSLDTFLLNQATLQKRDIILRTNYRPLKMSKQDQGQCVSIQSDLQHDQRLQNPSKKTIIQKKQRKLILDEQEEEDQQQSSSLYQSEKSSPQSQQIKPLSLDIMQFQYRETNNKEKKALNNVKEVQYINLQNTAPKKQKGFRRISQVNAILQSTPKQLLKRTSDSSNQIVNKNKCHINDNTKQNQCEDDQEQKDNEDNEDNIKQKIGQDKHWRQMKVNPFFQIANSIKPIFGQEFFKNPFGTSL